MGILSYWELPEEDQPNERIWGDDEALSAWFEMVKERRKARSRGEEPMEQVPQVTNDLAKEWGIG